MATCKWCLNECEQEFLAEVLVESEQDEEPHSRTYVFHICEPCLSNYAPPAEMILSRPRGQQSQGREDCRWCLSQWEAASLGKVLVDNHVLAICEPCLSNYAPPVEMILSRPQRQETRTVDGSESISEPNRFGFYLENLGSMLAVAISRMLFESSGYEVRPSGYEDLFPEWRAALKAGDSTVAAARIRTLPDIKVYDQGLNTLYEVEIKTTRRAPTGWRYAKSALDTLRYHHPEAVLMVYVQPQHQFYVQYVKRVP